MNRRTEGEIKAYVDGYTKCYNYREDEAVHRAIEEANRKQEDKSNGN